MGISRRDDRLVLGAFFTSSAFNLRRHFGWLKRYRYIVFRSRYIQGREDQKHGITCESTSPRSRAPLRASRTNAAASKTSVVVICHSGTKPSDDSSGIRLECRLYII